MRRETFALVGLVVLASAAMAMRLLIGRLTTGEIVIEWPEPELGIFRVRAMAAGAIVGAGLGVAGMLLQALLRNPLASPYILGVSSGAGLGVMVHLSILSLAGAGGSALMLGDAVPATLGAAGALVALYLLSRRGGVLDPLTLVLVGVVISTLSGAGIMFCQHLVPTGVHTSFVRWLMGLIPENASHGALLGSGAVVVGGAITSVWLGRAMDVAMLGEDEAGSLGLAIGPLRVVLFALAGLMTAITVALAGPVGFVGLIAPHAGRLLVGPRHRSLTVASALIGIVLVVGADVARQAIDLGAGRMPIGVFTALIGGPTFIWLLLSGRARV